MTYLYRCGVLSDSDPIIIYKALPCVVRMTRPEESVENRVLAAETLAYLIEANDELQRVAAISNHLIPNVASFLSVELDAQNGNDIINSNILVSGNSDLKRAAFRSDQSHTNSKRILKNFNFSNSGCLLRWGPTTKISEKESSRSTT